MLTFKKIIILLFGIVIIGFGASILIISNLGADAITILNQGLSITLNIDIGYATLLSNAILFILMLLFLRNKINIGTLFSVFLSGLFISLFIKLLPSSFSNNFFINLLFSITGLITASFGLSLYMYPNLGIGAFEGFVDILSNKLNINFGYAKILVDIIFFITGIILGGTFHVASILSVIIIGPLINLFTTLINKLNLINI